MKKVIASNGYLGIIDIIHDIDDKVKILDGKKVRTLKIYYTFKEGDAYFNLYGHRHHLRDFIRLDL